MPGEAKSVNGGGWLGKTKRNLPEEEH